MFVSPNAELHITQMISPAISSLSLSPSLLAALYPVGSIRIKFVRHCLEEAEGHTVHSSRRKYENQSHVVVVVIKQGMVTIHAVSFAPSLIISTLNAASMVVSRYNRKTKILHTRSSEWCKKK